MKKGIWSLAKEAGIALGDVPEKFDADWLERVFRFWTDRADRGFFSRKDRKQEAKKGTNTEASRILERHLIESLFLLMEGFRFYEELTGRPVSHETKILDAGSGPGVPGLLIPAWKDANPSTTLLDSSRRRLGLVEEHFADCRQLHFLYGRAEELRRNYDLIVSRAFLPFPICLEVLTNLVSKNGLYLMFAGEDPLRVFSANPVAQNQLGDYLKNCGFVSRGTKKIHALSFLGRRHILALQRTHKPSRAYPRTWKKIKESLTEWKKFSP